jgi:hypothetical protein
MMLPFYLYGEGGVKFIKVNNNEMKIFIAIVFASS